MLNSLSSLDLKTMNPYLLFSLGILGSFLVAYTLYFIFRVVMKKFFKSTRDKIDRSLRSAFYVLIIMILLKVTYTLSMLPDNLWSARIDKIFSIGLIIACTLFIYRFIDFSRSLFYSHLNEDQTEVMETRKARTQLEFIFKMASILIWIIGISAILMSFEGIRNFGTSILASAGIVGIIIGFAAQRSISNLFAGMQIAFTQPLKIDDAIVVENEFGTVEEITLTYVVLKLWDSRRIVFPISYFIDKPFQNWTRTSSDLLGTVFLYVDYSFPIEAARTQLQNILSLEPASNLWDKRLALVQVTDSNEQTMQLRILLSALNSSTLFELRVFVREKMIEFIQREFPNSLPKQRIERLEVFQHQV